ncbi:hypothetical protein DEO72_LG8g1349 [Vigna unguiculata]|uniref:Uncharacterized protein n=1 Tax=Vigna unguiculata TaxID=3917 RepID=A0A4D6MTX2_VIGUN|nr:hypothetical protein DEO72_LG8g1349 [Vigna unguiculata]
MSRHFRCLKDAITWGGRPGSGRASWGGRRREAAPRRILRGLFGRRRQGPDSSGCGQGWCRRRGCRT